MPGKISSFPPSTAANALLQGPGFPLRQSVLCAEMARNPKWCWETLKHSEIWMILKVCKHSSVHIFRRLLVFPHFFGRFPWLLFPCFYLRKNKPSFPSLNRIQP